MKRIFVYNENQEIPSVGELGEKAKNLAVLTAKNITVPKWIALTADFFSPKEESFQALLNHKLTDKKIPQISQNIIDSILKKEWTEDLKNEVTHSINENFSNPKDTYFAVRPSLPLPDGMQCSLNGKLESTLYVMNDSSLFDCLKKTYAFFYTEKALRFYLEKSISLKSLKPCVILQEMVPGEISGMLYTVNPLNNHPDQYLIQSHYGIDRVDLKQNQSTDFFVIDKNHCILSKKTAKKESMLTFNALERQGTAVIPVEVASQEKESLSDELLDSLAILGKIIEQDIFNGIPQQIKWIIKNSRVYILQSNPIEAYVHINKSMPSVVLSKFFPAGQSSVLFDTPLEYSFFKKYISGSIKETASFFKIQTSQIKEIEPFILNLGVYFNSQSYLNLNSIFRILKECAGYTLKPGLLLESYGLKHSVELTGEESRKPQFKKSLINRFSLSKKISQKTLQKHALWFQEKVQKLLEDESQADLNSLSAQEIIRKYRQFMNQFISLSVFLFANELGLFLSYSFLRKKASKLKLNNLDLILKKIFPEFESFKTMKGFFQSAETGLDEAMPDTSNFNDSLFAAKKELIEKTNFINKPSILKLIDKTRFHLKLKAESKKYLLQATSHVFKLIQSLAKRLEKDQVIAQWDDIQFLSIREILEIFEGQSLNQKTILSLIELRKKAYASLSGSSPMNEVAFYGEFYSAHWVDVL